MSVTTKQTPLDADVRDAAIQRAIDQLLPFRDGDETGRIGELIDTLAARVENPDETGEQRLAKAASGLLELRKRDLDPDTRARVEKASRAVQAEWLAAVKDHRNSPGVITVFPHL